MLTNEQRARIIDELRSNRGRVTRNGLLALVGIPPKWGRCPILTELTTLTKQYGWRERKIAAIRYLEHSSYQKVKLKPIEHDNTFWAGKLEGLFND